MKLVVRAGLVAAGATDSVRLAVLEARPVIGSFPFRTLDRAVRIYDGLTEVHCWSLALKIKHDWKAAQQ